MQKLFVQLNLRNVAVAAAVAALTVATGSPASAGGRIFLTGHDTDFHYGGASANAAMAADLAFVTNGSPLPFLTFDSGTELTSAIAAEGYSYFNVDPNNAGAINDLLFNASTYSAIAVASHESCGGCDNTSAGLANLATHVSAIGAFLTAGGGILGFAGADDPSAYAYVPTAASNGGGSPPPTGFVETAAGLAAGLVAENGDATHNFFNTPGTGGLSALFQVAETNSGNVESIFLTDASVICSGESCALTSDGPVGVTPLPDSLPLFVSGLGVLALLGWLAMRKNAVAGQAAA